MTEKLRAMEDKMKKDMEARESQWRAEMEEQKAQLQAEMEQMRRTQEQLQNLTRVMQNMIHGNSGGSREPEMLPRQVFTYCNISNEYVQVTCTSA